LALTLSALTASARFEAAMGQRPCARSAHFSVHYLPSSQLSTATAQPGPAPVDDAIRVTPDGGILRLGLVVPKRHARRSVTRSLIKRQLRERLRERLPELPAGEWVLRLRAPIDRKAYPSARSEALAQSLREELGTLLHDAARRLTRSPGAAPGQARSARTDGAAT
jgi:ribonuclease P protein component